ncbi:hypothetical protein AgCh_025355 [Apium graveolens]
MKGDYVNSLEEFDTTVMDSVWLAIKIPRKMNDDSRIELSKMEAARNEVVSVQGYSDSNEFVILRLTHLFKDHMSVLRYRLMRSLREDNVDLPYVRMKL